MSKKKSGGPLAQQIIDELERRNMTKSVKFRLSSDDTKIATALGWESVQPDHVADVKETWQSWSILHPVLRTVPTALTHRDVLNSYKNSDEFHQYVQNRLKAESLTYEQAWARKPNGAYDSPFPENFQKNWYDLMEGIIVLNPPGVFAYNILFRLGNLLKCWTFKCDRRFNEAYKLFWQENIIVDNWLALAALFNWIILSAPTIFQPLRLWRAEPKLPHYAKGTIIPIRRMLATSISLAACVTGFFDEKERCCAYEIIVPPGFPLLSVFNLDISKYQDELEVLLPATFDANGLNPTYGLQIVGKKNVTMKMLVDKVKHHLASDFIEGERERQRLYRWTDYTITTFVCVPVLMPPGKSFTDVDAWEGPLREQFSKSRIPSVIKENKDYDNEFWKQPDQIKPYKSLNLLKEWDVQLNNEGINILRERMIKNPTWLLPKDEHGQDDDDEGRLFGFSTAIEEQVNIKLALINRQITSLMWLKSKKKQVVARKEEKQVEETKKPKEMKEAPAAKETKKVDEAPEFPKVPIVAAKKEEKKQQQSESVSKRSKKSKRSKAGRKKSPSHQTERRNKHYNLRPRF